jgi:hypothetical protein
VNLPFYAEVANSMTPCDDPKRHRLLNPTARAVSVLQKNYPLFKSKYGRLLI